MTTNLYSYNQSSAEVDASGFTAVASTIAQSSAQAWQGTHSILTTTDGGGGFQGIEVFLPVSSFLVNLQYTFSAYFFNPSGTPTVRFYCQTNSGSIGSSPNITLGNGAWERHSFTVTMPASFTGITQIGLRWDTGSVNQALAIYLDGLQCEQSASASAWVPGNSRLVPTVAALLATTSRAVPSQAALSQTSARAVPTSAALYATLSRAVPNVAALMATASRAVPSRAALLQTSSRAVPSAAALLQTSARAVPTVAALAFAVLAGVATLSDTAINLATISDTQVTA